MGSISELSDDGVVSGVRLRPLARQRNGRGDLVEILRPGLDDLGPVGQIYTTTTLPGVVKAWYRHRRQTDRLVVIGGAFHLVVWDGRIDSPTRDRVAGVRLRGEDPWLVLIPPGVWHGFCCESQTPGLMLHVNSHAWVAEDPDEERLDPDAATVPRPWTTVGTTT